MCLKEANPTHTQYHKPELDAVDTVDTARHEMTVAGMSEGTADDYDLQNLHRSFLTIPRLPQQKVRQIDYLLR